MTVDTDPTTTVRHERPARDDVPRPAPRATDTTSSAVTRKPRAWAVSGALAAVAGLTGVMVSSTAGGVYDFAIAGDADKILLAVSADRTLLLVFHVLVAVAAMLLVPFGLGLGRRLRATLDGDSLLPGVATVGVLLTAGILVMGSGLDTEFLIGRHEPGQVVAENVAMYNHWVGTIPWLWTGTGLTGVAVAVASLRHRATPRWIGVAGLVLGGVTLLLGLSPLEYMAGMTGPLWMFVTALGFTLGDRTHRRG